MTPMHPMARLRKILAEVEQMRRDAEWWNANRPDAPPFDVGQYVAFAVIVRGAMAAWGTDRFAAAADKLTQAAAAFADA